MINGVHAMIEAEKASPGYVYKPEANQTEEAKTEAAVVEAAPA